MTPALGYNPLRWKCEDRGCFNIKQRPKIEIFADCLPGKLAFSDVDAITEVKGRFLILEFKGGQPRDMPIGQRILFQRLTQASRGAIQVVIVCGDAETMVVTHASVISKGKQSPWVPCDRDQLRSRIRAWADRAQSLAPAYLRPL